MLYIQTPAPAPKKMRVQDFFEDYGLTELEAGALEAIQYEERKEREEKIAEETIFVHWVEVACKRFETLR